MLLGTSELSRTDFSVLKDDLGLAGGRRPGYVDRVRFGKGMVVVSFKGLILKCEDTGYELRLCRCGQRAPRNIYAP